MYSVFQKQTLALSASAVSLIIYNGNMDMNLSKGNTIVASNINEKIINWFQHKNEQLSHSHSLEMVRLCVSVIKLTGHWPYLQKKLHLPFYDI